MSDTVEIKPLICDTLYDMDGRMVGKYDIISGRGMFSHTFFEDVRTCTVEKTYAVPPRAFEAFGPMSFVTIQEYKCVSCEHLWFEDGECEPNYCPNCGGKVVE